MAAISPHLGPGAAPALEAGALRAAVAPAGFEEVYAQTFDFVFRTLRRAGVPEASVDDALQDVFVVVHRRLPEFAARSSIKTWIYGIAVNVASDHRRRDRRKGGHEPLDVRLPDGALDPAESFARAEALRELDRLLASLDADKRDVFVLAEIEQMTAPEIAEALSLNVNTVYSRLRAARREIEAAVAALEASDP
jgi:RNA polymerase sigma-70 factor (ECF subfamily)